MYYKHIKCLNSYFKVSNFIIFIFILFTIIEQSIDYFSIHDWKRILTSQFNKDFNKGFM